MHSVVPEPRPEPGSAARRRAWAVLSRAAVHTPQRVHQLLDEYGPEEAADQIVTGTAEYPADPHAFARADRDLESAAAAGGRLVARDDPDWPARLANVGACWGDSSVPVALWVRGSAPLDTFARTVAVTGAAAATDYGLHVAADLTRGLAAHDRTIINGGAFGVDAAALTAALSADAPAIAVLPAGLDRPHPHQQADLFTRIADHGVLVSEYPPGTLPRRARFQDRHRLVAALSTGVVVCESGVRSSSLHALRWARRLRRPVAAIPGSIYSASSRGCHQLIRDGHAHLATSVDDVLDLVTGRHTQGGNR